MHFPTDRTGRHIPWTSCGPLIGTKIAQIANSSNLLLRNITIWLDHLFVLLLVLFYAIVTVFQLYHAGDMMYDMTRRKPEPTLLLTQRIFNLPHHVGTEWEELIMMYVIHNREMNCSTANCYGSNMINIPVPRVTNPAPLATELSTHSPTRLLSLHKLLGSIPVRM